ncbi:MAG TPA: ferritin family protein [Spirochaetota bacterium]|jgi:rubrerythrin|nr:MAG: Rubrerythrin [Spirochaetes bacterium ADurb.Bin133]HNZ26490.1 ferritin family protein [Spirochaetota bacterium]HPY87269.1 ferritin family protein [Spirochaetota bacterium]HQB60550.1 ferritin family protein [Spirochaetota bacterium]
MSTFNASEIYQFAIKIESDGEKFYREFSKKFKDKAVSALFNDLADEEVSHRVFFENGLKSFNKYDPAESFPDEYFAYLRAFAENIVFVKDNLEKEIEKIDTKEAALDFAIKRELDTIHYYMEMKGLVSASEVELIDKIIAEERNHFIKLNNLKA